MKEKDCCSASDALFEASGYRLPDEHGHFGPYGGIFVSDTPGGGTTFTITVKSPAAGNGASNLKRHGRRGS